MAADTKQRLASKKFVEFWTDKGYEKGQSQPFWLSLLREVFGVAEPEKIITFEDQVHLDNTSFIDGYIESTHVMIEQKSLGKNLNKQIKQSDGSYLTPYEQAKRYSMELPYSKRPYMDLACDIKYDMEHNQHPYKTDKEFLAYVKTRLSGSDQMYALRTFEHNYRAWLRSQNSK